VRGPPENAARSFFYVPSPQFPPIMQCHATFYIFMAVSLPL
jgi:hypothetical protein